MGSNRRMDHMTWPEFKEAKTRPVIVPIGSTEQHGQHLPIGTDTVLATRVAEDLAERIDGTVLPTLSYGYKSKPLSGGGPLFPGTIDMNGVTVINQMHDVLSELIADGFTKIVVMNAHFEKRGVHRRGHRSGHPRNRGSGHHRGNQLVGPGSAVGYRQGVRWIGVPRQGIGACGRHRNFVDAPLCAGTGAHGPYGRGSRCHGEILCPLPCAPR